MQYLFFMFAVRQAAGACSRPTISVLAAQIKQSLSQLRCQLPLHKGALKRRISLRGIKAAGASPRPTFHVCSANISWRSHFKHQRCISFVKDEFHCATSKRREQPPRPTCIISCLPRKHFMAQPFQAPKVHFIRQRRISLRDVKAAGASPRPTSFIKFRQKKR